MYIQIPNSITVPFGNPNKPLEERAQLSARLVFRFSKSYLFPEMI